MSLSVQYEWFILPISTLLSISFCFLLIPIAHKVGWVDHPGLRKVHLDSTPLVGGIAIYMAIALLIGLVQLIPGISIFNSHWITVVMIGALIIMIVGGIDDRWSLSPIIRFLMQILACVFVIRFTGWHLEDFGALFSSTVVSLGFLAIPITLFAALGVINSFNLADGLDGLAGSLFLVSAVGLIGFSITSGQFELSWFLAVASASVFGFLLLNARFSWNDRARLFLGDAGSLMLGFILAWGFIRLGSGEDRAYMPMTAVWLFAVPLLDTASLIWRRWREGRSAIHADQSHLHHVFLRAGYSVEETWGRIMLLAAILAGLGVFFELSGLPNWLSFYTFMLIAFSYYFYLKHCWAAQRFLGRHFIHHDFEIDESLLKAKKTDFLNS